MTEATLKTWKESLKLSRRIFDIHAAKIRTFPHSSKFFSNKIAYSPKKVLRWPFMNGIGTQKKREANVGLPCRLASSLRRLHTLHAANIRTFSHPSKFYYLKIAYFPKKSAQVAADERYKHTKITRGQRGSPVSYGIESSPTPYQFTLQIYELFPTPPNFFPKKSHISPKSAQVTVHERHRHTKYD